MMLTSTGEGSFDKSMGQPYVQITLKASRTYIAGRIRPMDAVKLKLLPITRQAGRVFLGRLENRSLRKRPDLAGQYQDKRKIK